MLINNYASEAAEFRNEFLKRKLNDTAPKSETPAMSTSTALDFSLPWKKRKYPSPQTMPIDLTTTASTAADNWGKLHT